MKDKVFSIIANQTGMKETDLSLDTNLLKDISINSFDLMTMITDFEDEFDIEISEQEIKKIRTINDIIELLKSKE